MSFYVGGRACARWTVTTTKRWGSGGGRGEGGDASCLRAKGGAPACLSVHKVGDLQMVGEGCVEGGAACLWTLNP